MIRNRRYQLLTKLGAPSLERNEGTKLATRTFNNSGIISINAASSIEEPATIGRIDLFCAALTKYNL